MFIEHGTSEEAEISAHLLTRPWWLLMLAKFFTIIFSCSRFSVISGSFPGFRPLTLAVSAAVFLLVDFFDRLGHGAGVLNVFSAYCRPGLRYHCHVLVLG